MRGRRASSASQYFFLLLRVARVVPLIYFDIEGAEVGFERDTKDESDNRLLVTRRVVNANEQRERGGGGG